MFLISWLNLETYFFDFFGILFQEFHFWEDSKGDDIENRIDIENQRYLIEGIRVNICKSKEYRDK